MNRVLRKFNFKIAPVLLFPLLMTSLTGILLGVDSRFKILPKIVLEGLIAIHQGEFLGKKLLPIYVLLLGLGIFAIGLRVLIKARDSLISRQAKPFAVNTWQIIALVLVFPLAVSTETGVAYRLGTDWLNMTNQQTAIFRSIHTGASLGLVLGIIYTLVTGFDLIALSIVGLRTSLADKTIPHPKRSFPTIPIKRTFKYTSGSNNTLVLRKKIRIAIIVFSLIFIAIISFAISAILPSVFIVGIVFTLPAWLIAQVLIQDWQQQQKIKTVFDDRESESATILRAIPDSMLRISEDGVCLSYIPAKEANSFVIVGEIINKHISEFLDPQIALRFIKSAKLSLETGLTHFHRFSIPTDDEVQQYYEARISAIGITEVLIMIRQLSNLDRASVESERASKPSSKDTILLLSEPELAEILEQTLSKISQSDRYHTLCCLVVDLPVDLERQWQDSRSMPIDFLQEEAVSDSPQDSNIGGILMYQIAAKMKFYLSSDCIARLNERELVALVLNCSLEQASVSIDKLREDLNNFSFQWQGNEYPIETSIGLLEINADSTNSKDLIDAAKATCNIAKQKVDIKTFW